MTDHQPWNWFYDNYDLGTVFVSRNVAREEYEILIDGIKQEQAEKLVLKLNSMEKTLEWWQEDDYALTEQRDRLQGLVDDAVPYMEILRDNQFDDIDEWLEDADR